MYKKTIAPYNRYEPLNTDGTTYSESFDKKKFFFKRKRLNDFGKKNNVQKIELKTVKYIHV